MRRVVLTPGAEQATTGISLKALMDRVHSDRAIPPRRNYFLLIHYTFLSHQHLEKQLAATEYTCTCAQLLCPVYWEVYIVLEEVDGCEPTLLAFSKVSDSVIE
jgi:hypothetical protein